jgi:hypothetical protein
MPLAMRPTEAAFASVSIVYCRVEGLPDRARSDPIGPIFAVADVISVKVVLTPIVIFGRGAIFQRGRYPHRSARAFLAKRFAAIASRYGASASRSALVMAAENSPTIVMPRLVRTGLILN